MRVRFETLPGEADGGSEAALRKPQSPPPGYSRNTVITEWLTLNCRGDWGSKSDGVFVRARFREADDCVRASAQFG